MILSLIAALTLQGPALVCPMMLEEVGKDGHMMDFNGVRYGICCDTCEAKFMKDPNKILSNKKIADNLVGFALFDPITGVRIEEKKSKAFSDYKNVRYYFTSTDEKKTFDTKPDAYATMPKKEVLWCPVMGHDIDTVSEAGGYVTVGDTRYYTCCTDCQKKLQEQTAALTPGAKDHVKDPVVVLVKETK